MKLKVINCSLYAQPENDSDLNTLLKLTGDRKVVIKKQYVGKAYKKSCDVCGAKVKYLGQHKRYNHDPAFRAKLAEKKISKGLPF